MITAGKKYVFTKSGSIVTAVFDTGERYLKNHPGQQLWQVKKENGTTFVAPASSLEEVDEENLV